MSANPGNSSRSTSQRPRRYGASALLLLCISCCSATRAWADGPFVFRDVGDEAGLFPHLGGIAGHGVGWGDVDGDGWADLYVATFGGHPYDSKPNQLFLNRQGKFALDAQPQLRVLGRANGAIFADLDDDGDLDLYTTNHAIDGQAYGQPHYGEPNHLFRNEGGGKFTDVSVESGTCSTGIAARSVAAVDYNGDGLLDLLVGECFFQGGQSRTRLYRNRGGLKFDNVTAEAGLPEPLTGFGVAAADVNGDGWPDLMTGGRHHGNRLFVNDGRGHFREVPASHAAFVFEYKDTPDDTACGVCFGDVNRDGRPDVVIGSHFDRPWWTGGVAVRLYLNRGEGDGWPRFEDVTQRAGLVPLPMKSPHVEIQDFDNDGWPDIYTSIVKFRGNEAHPVIFRNQGLTEELPVFHEDALAVNDFPTAEDRAMESVGPFFDKMEREHKIVYTAPGPTCDFDRDGRLDMFLGNWWVKQRSLLLKNETKAGNWLQVAVRGPEGVNRNGIGAVVRVFPAGKLGQDDALWCAREIAVGFGYASGQEALAHIGLGELPACDVEVILPHGKGRLQRKRVEANQRLTIQIRAEPAPGKWIEATAYVIPKETATEGEGYFSIIEGHNSRLYIGTHANAVNSWLVEFDPAAKKMDVVVDTHKAIGKDLKGFGSQAKIHTRNNTGKLTGKIYFGTKQGYPSADEKREDYPGGYPMVYDPKTGQTKVYPIPVPHHGINSITPDESRGVAYISTCSDHRPGPGENAIFLILDLATGKYRQLMDTEHFYGFIVVDYLGRAYHPILGGDIARYDPRTDRLERLKQTIDGQPPSDAARLALNNPDPINWDISPDGKTLYAQPMSGNGLYAYDLTAEGDTLPGRSLGELIPGATKVDCRAMCVGPSGAAWCAVTENVEGMHILHLVRYRPGDAAPVDLGAVSVKNPDFTEFTDKDGKTLPFHAGFIKRDDGRMTTRYVIMGVCEAKDGKVYILALHPYSVLQVQP